MTRNNLLGIGILAAIAGAFMFGSRKKEPGALGALGGFFDTDKIKDVDALKKQYYKLARQYHPDTGGTKEDFQSLSNEYEKLLNKLLSGQGLTSEEKANEIELDENLRKAYFAIMRFPEITIELAFKWLWVSGATYPIRNELKAAGFQFAPKKKMWYFKGIEAKRGGNLSIDDIRSKWGSVKLQTVEDRYLSGTKKKRPSPVNSKELVKAFKGIRRALKKRKVCTETTNTYIVSK